MSIFPRPLKKVLNKIIPFSQEDKIPTFNLGSGVADSTTYLRGDGTWATPVSGGGMKSGIATYTITDQYTTTIAGVTSYTTNDAYIIKFNNQNVDGASLNINGLGAISLVKNNDVTITGGDIRVGQEFLVVYDGTNFQIIGIAPNQMFAYVTNADSVTINKGQPVYAFGAAGDRMSVKLAYNTSDATSAKTVGLVFSSSIAPNGTGFIITQGVIQNLNLASYTAGDTLYLGATAGTFTKIKPYAPNHLVYIGIVERANAGNGQIYVRVQNGYELDELHDVYINPSTLSDNNIIQYDSATSLWKNESLSTAGIQPTLVSGTNIKTINGNSVLGSGDITITPSSSITIGTTPITSGVDGRVLFQNSSVVQQSTNFVFNPSTNSLGIGTSSPSGIVNAVSGVSDFRFSNGLSAVTPTISAINTNASGKAVALAAGTSGSVFAFDNTGFFGIVGEAKSNFTSNSIGGGSIFLRVETDGKVSIGSSAAQAKLDVRAQGALSTDISLRVRNSADTRSNLTVNGLGQTRVLSNSFSGNFFTISYVADNSVERDAFIFTQNVQNAMGQAWTFDAGYNGVQERLIISNNLTGINQGIFSIHASNFCFGTTILNNDNTADRRVLRIATGVAPTTSFTDGFKFYSADIVAGNAAPHFRTENGSIIKLFQGAALTASDGTLANSVTRIAELEARLKAHGLIA